MISDGAAGGDNRAEMRGRLLIIQIPCLNEAETLPQTLADLPRVVPGFDRVEWLVVDDGSTDGTAAVARAHGVDHVVRLNKNQGLARAFLHGLRQGLRLGADVIVNTDADNQYCAAGIPDLVRPIVERRAEMVVGVRPISSIAHFSPLKKALQFLGSWLVGVISGLDVRDAPSGFRAFSRRAAATLNVYNTYTYTLETLIQAGRKNMPVEQVDISVNGPTRPSRLIRSIPSFILYSGLTMIRIGILYSPMRFFFMLAAVLFVPGLSICLRFLYLFMEDGGQGHVQSLLLGAILIILGVFSLLFGVCADLISANRSLLEEIAAEQRLRSQQAGGGRES